MERAGSSTEKMQDVPAAVGFLAAAMGKEIAQVPPP
jgi:hypothetical protein